MEQLCVGGSQGRTPRESRKSGIAVLPVGEVQLHRKHIRFLGLQPERFVLQETTPGSFHEQPGSASSPERPPRYQDFGLLQGGKLNNGLEKSLSGRAGTEDTFPRRHNSKFKLGYVALSDSGCRYVINTECSRTYVYEATASLGNSFKQFFC
ncbi:hypothetical protein FQA47_023048 [Oryzias melastigma]|uniref:Uncharacterized protein n=1 Tax=Oryzias melastigma TaxID=30732 RepID=A0A834BZB1_ORYME|nr:hypothetical protein FQA47_023048 [Oryzias melastigma]